MNSAIRKTLEAVKNGELSVDDALLAIKKEPFDCLLYTSTCDSVTKMLAKVGMRSEWTLSGKEAILRARQSTELGDAFHAYIIDWRLPDMNCLLYTSFS